MTTAKTNLLDYDRPAMRAWFETLGEPSFRADQVTKWIYHHYVTCFTEMTNLSKALRQRLAAVASVEPPRVIADQTAADGTRKWLIGFGGANAVETVFIPEADRGTLCISSQVGCALNCQFCSTARQGFSRNLTTAEIIGQVWVAGQALAHSKAENRRITNIVMMGMGEPLANFEPVVAAIRLMLDDFAFGFGARRVTVSTAGMVPQIDQLSQEVEAVLAVSLHAPNDELRSKIVPLNRKYPIADLLAACRRYVEGKRKAVVTFEYTMLDGVNDTPELAHQLVRLIKGFPAKINLIPFNPFPGAPFRRSSDEAIAAFQQILREGGFVTTVRKTRGDDIDAACGQLVGNVLDRTRRSRVFAQQDRAAAEVAAA